MLSNGGSLSLVASYEERCLESFGTYWLTRWESRGESVLQIDIVNRDAFSRASDGTEKRKSRKDKKKRK